MLDLNDDCFFAIFEYISFMDICSIAQTSSRLNTVGREHFDRKNKICNFNEMQVNTTAAAEKFFKIFGALILELNIDCSLFSPDIMDPIIQHCASTLESLKIRGYQIPDTKESLAGMKKLFQNLKKLRLEYVSIEKFFDERLEEDSAIFTPNRNLVDIFVDCKSLTNLEVVESDDLDRVILESVFPKLEKFKYFKESVDTYMEGFVFRHKNLKSISFDSYQTCDYDGHIPALKVVAANCKKLEKLEFAFGSGTDDSETDAGEGLFWNNLSKLPKLKELKVLMFTDGFHFELFIHMLPNWRQTLEVLQLERLSDGGRELIAAITQLKKLRVLKLRTDYDDDTVLGDINPLGALESLDELWIDNMFERNLKFNFIQIIVRLVNLTKVKIRVNGFKMENEAYRRLAAAVERRPDRTKRSLQIDCKKVDGFIDLKLDSVKFVQLE